VEQCRRGDGCLRRRAARRLTAPGTGWTTVFDDNFAGAAGSAPSYNWMYDTGGANQQWNLP
jgi:hypothetical protein